MPSSHCQRRQASDAAAVTIRPAQGSDVPALGRLGVLLVGTHHEFDPERFEPASSRTKHGYAYATFLASQLDNPEAVGVDERL